MRTLGTTMYWLAHIEGGPRRVNHTAVPIGDYIYSFGGYCSSEDYRLRTIDVHVLNTQNLRWSQVPPRKDGSGLPLQYPEVPFQRYGHTTVAYENKVYMWGGRNDDTGCNILFCFDTQTARWTKPQVTGDIPGVRDGHSACIIGSYMYIFGGFVEEINQFSCDVHELNLKTMHWSYIRTRGQPPRYRDFHTATVLNNRMYIFGGRGDTHGPYYSQEEIYCSQIVYLDLKTKEWKHPNTTGAIPIGRRSHSAFIYKDLLYVFGGYNGITDQHFNDLYSFDPAKNRWSLVSTRGSVPKPRRRQVCLVIDKRLYLFGGTSPYEIDTMRAVPRPRLLDYSDTHVLDFEPNLKTLCLMAVIENNLDQTYLPQDIRWEIRTMTTANTISRPLNKDG